MTDFCKECGTALEGHGIYCVRCGSHAGEARINLCPVCGCPCEPNAGDCSKEGYNLRKYEEIKRQKEKQEDKLSLCILPIAIGSIIFLILSGALNRLSNPESLSILYAGLFFIMVVALLFATVIIKKNINKTFKKKIESIKKEI